MPLPVWVSPSVMYNQRTIPTSFLGTWRIREIGEHTREEIDLIGPAQIVFEENGRGSIRFTGVKPDLDARFQNRAGSVFADFTWEGLRAGEVVSGRGWAVVLKTGGMMGHLYVHRQGDANFTAVRKRKRKSG